MKSDLKKIGITEEMRYECIYTTIDGDGVKNAAAIGFKYMGDDKVACRIFEESKTLENIRKTNKYVVNITQDPLIFTKATLDNLSSDDFSDDEDIAVLRDVPSYFTVEVLDIKELIEDDGPIQNDKTSFLIKGKITSLVINDDSVKAFNRGFPAIIECLVNFSRYKIVDDDKRCEYMGRVNENQRMINRIGDEKTKEIMSQIREEYEKN